MGDIVTSFRNNFLNGFWIFTMVYKVGAGSPNALDYTKMK
jgi:hypothetical protein